MKTWNLEYKGYTVTVRRNERKDVFLGFITNTNNTEYIEKIQPKRSLFLTLKGAKQFFVETVNSL